MSARWLLPWLLAWFLAGYVGGFYYYVIEYRVWYDLADEAAVLADMEALGRR